MQNQAFPSLHPSRFKFDKQKTLKNFDEFVERHNANAPTYSFVRKSVTPDGEIVEQTVTRRENTIRNTIKNTFSFISKQYEIVFNGYIKHNGVPHTLSDLPPIRTNNERMSRILGASSRTFRSHIKLLEDLGVVSKKFCGSNADFELRINPKWMVNPFGHKLTDWYSTSTPKPVFEQSSRKNFPHIYLNKINKRDIDIDKAENVDMSIKKYSNSGYVAQDSSSTQQKPSLDSQKKEKGFAGNLSENVDKYEDRVENRTNRVDFYEKLTKQQQNYVMEFWLHAWAMLFTGQKFNDNEQKQILSDITKSVFMNFNKKWSEDVWDRYFSDVKEVVDMVSAYMARNPERYLPAPYSIAIAGKGYFDPQNDKNGFTGAFKWLKNKRNLAAKKRSERTLQSAQRHITQISTDDSKLPLKFKTFTYPQLYTYYEGKLKSENPQLLSKFYAFVSHLPKTNQSA